MKLKFWSPLPILFSLILIGIMATAVSHSLANPLAAPGSDDTVTQPDDFVARVYYNDPADLQKLMAYDVWEYNNLQEKYVLVAMNNDIYTKLQQEGWQITLDETATNEMHNSTRSRTFSGGYRTVTELYNDLTTINNAHPNLTEVVNYGNSYCLNRGGCTMPGGQTTPGYPLKAIRITNEAIPGPKPVFFMMANIHAREITTPELAMRFVNWLVDGYGTDPDATWIVDWHEVWIIPSANPDGHWIVELGPYYQRKNANASNGCATQWPPSSSSHFGVDMNRNSSFGWNTGGTSTNPCDQTYLGPSAASEIEVSQLQSFISSKIPDQRGPGINDPAPDTTSGIFITLHSYSELVLWPWGNTTSPAPNKAGLQAIGDKFATYNGYQSCQPSVCLYIASGASDDYAYGELGVPAYTFEVGTAFMPTYATIDSTQWPQNKPAFIYAAKIARTPYKLAFGPDALSLTTSVSGTNLTVNGSINDSKNGNQAISSAVYYIDTPPWAGGTNTGSLNASDGAFNSAIESVNGTINVSGLSTGQHMIFVQGKDSGNNSGPFSAAFFTVGGAVTPTPTATPGGGSCTTLTSSDVPKAISSSGTPSVSSLLNVSGLSGNITDVNVLNLNGTHTWINDLDFNLISPAGTAVQIMAQSCSSEDNFGLNLDDEAAAGSWPCPPVGGGTYRPSNALTAFDGQAANGTWTLRVDDNASSDGGSLNSWSLQICTDGGTGPTPTPTNTPQPPTTTAWQNPSTNAPVTTSSGDNNGFETSPTNAYSDNALFAVDTNSGTGTSTSCTSTTKDRHDFATYGFSVPAGATVDGLEVRLDAKVDSTSGTPKLCVQLSWDGGTTWTTAKTSATLTTAEASYILGGSADNWGHVWSSTEANNVRVRIIPVASSTARDFSLDWTAVRLTYH